MSDQAVLLPKWSPHGGIILAKGWLDHSNTFWTMANYTYYTSTKFAESQVNFCLVSISTVKKIIPVYTALSSKILLTFSDASNWSCKLVFRLYGRFQAVGIVGRQQAGYCHTDIKETKLGKKLYFRYHVSIFLLSLQCDLRLSCYSTTLCTVYNEF